MTFSQKLSVINLLVMHYQANEAQWDKAISVFGTHENPLYEAHWRAMDAYISTVETLIGDAFGNVSWYLYDNQCGKKGLRVTYPGKKKKHSIKTTTDLLKWIEAQA